MRKRRSRSWRRLRCNNEARSQFAPPPHGVSPFAGPTQGAWNATCVSKFRAVSSAVCMIPTASLNLDEQLCFALYAATSQIIRAYRRPLAAIGLTYPQYLAMLVLWERGEQTVKGLSDRLALDSSTLTPLLKRLELAGFVIRKRDASDERVVRISATPAGQALRRPAAQIQKKVACKTRLPNDGFVRLRSQLHELAKTMAAEQELHEPQKQ